MGFFKKLFGGKSESEKTQEVARERADKLAERHMQIIREKIAYQEKTMNLATDSSSHDEMIKFEINEKESWDSISYCLESDDFYEFTDLLIDACENRKMYFFFPKKKWDKAIREFDKQKELYTVSNQIFGFNNKGTELEKKGDIENAILMYEESVKLYEDNTNKFRTRYQYDRLILLYHKLKDFDNEKRILTKVLALYPDDSKCIKKLAILNGSHEEKVISSAPKDITVSKIWGDLLEVRILEVPEFDFYFEREANPQKYEHEFGEIGQILKPIFEVREHFKSIETEAQTAEDMGEQEQAARLYEQMVAEKYYMPSPYDRLIKIYSKAKLHDEEIRILKVGIAHFKQLREKRKAYVLHLAQKYDAVDFANERIISGKKITYYDGAFELYNPFPIVERWEARLQKILRNK